QILPHGVPELMFTSPQDYGALDLKVSFLCHNFHPIFDLVPRPLNALLEEHYNDLGCPTVTCLTIWHIYLDLLHAVQDYAMQDCALLPDLPTSPLASADADNDLPLLKGQCNLPFNDANDGYYYMGSVGGGLGLGKLVFSIDQ
ncbi:hypothetical protein BKA83DRAFT_4068763, partial [Pisolithus microcarpus]